MGQNPTLGLLLSDWFKARDSLDTGGKFFSGTAVGGRK
jgi:hypothetical protein